MDIRHCATCEAEYRPEIEVCPECGGELGAGPLEEPERFGAPAAVLETTDEGQLDVARGLLETAGIESFVRGREGASVFPLFGGWTAFDASHEAVVYVAEPDAERARRVLEELEALEGED